MPLLSLLFLIFRNSPQQLGMVSQELPQQLGMVSQELKADVSAVDDPELRW